MKNDSYLLLFLIAMIFFACEEKEKPKEENTIAFPFVPLIRPYTRSDTVRFKADSRRMAVIGLLHPLNSRLEDSSRKLPVDVLYYVNGQQISAHTDTFYTRDEEELSYYFEGTDTNGNSCERFFTVNFGYPACGYNQYHLTFSVDAAGCYFVCRHSSFADGAYGGGMEFFDPCGHGSGMELFSAIVNRGDDEDTGDSITVSYTESTIYRFDGEFWTSQLCTEKDKVYRRVRELL